MGSGLGGLVSSIILAKEGYRVCVLEKNNQYGGSLQTFVREKTIFDTGVHYLGGLEKGQNLYQIYNYLGIINDLPLERMDINAYDNISFGDDSMVFPHAQGYNNFTKQLLHYFPSEREAIVKYCTDIQAICKKFPLYNLEPGKIHDWDVMELNLKEYMDSLTSNETLKSVLVGSNFLYAGNENTPLYVHALTLNSYISSAWKCRKGGSQITKSLIQQLRKHKGDIFKRQEVTKILFEEDKICGIVTKNGIKYNAKAFISNIELNTTIRLIGEGKLRKSFTQRVNNLKVTPSSFSVHIVLKKNTLRYKNQNHYHFKSKSAVWTAAEANTDNWPQMYMVSMSADNAKQEYADSISILTYMNYAEMQQWESTVNTIVDPNFRCEEYKRFKEEKTEQLLNEVEKKFPHIRSAIQSVYTSTPLSYRDYIGGKEGNLYGFENDSRQPLLTTFSPRTKIPNLFLTGQSVNMHGILGVTIGAVNTCAEIVGREHLINQIKEENRAY